MPPAAAGYSAGMKRPLAAVAPSCDVDGGNAAAAAAAKRRERRREAKRARAAAAAAGALVPYVAPIDARPIRAVPLAAAAAPRKEADDQAAAAPPAEPAWIRKILLERLGLTYDQPVVFIARKTVTRTDLDPHQNRFRLPIFGVERRLLPMLTLDEAKEANLVENDEEKGVPRPRPRPKKKRRTEKGRVVAADGELQKPQGTTPETNVEGEDQAPPRPKPVPKKKKRRTEKGSVDVADGEQQQQQQEATVKEPRKKAQGKDHGGVPVTVLHLSGAMRELRLVLWDSSHGTIIKGTGYMDFIAGTGLREHDAVQIWAFKRRGFRLFGATVPESRFYLVIVGGSWRPLEASPPLCMLPPSHAPVEVCA
uniref:TF-B3 domain-containing protein n=1 Tax=Oryza meridionalis TaxID=40149 RepID=A0A0E0C5Z2_9ORYZ